MKKLSESTILVTGGAGFIGSNLVTQLMRINPEKIIIVDNFSLKRIGGNQRGYELIKEFINGCKFIKEDVSDYSHMRKLLNEWEIDCVFNLAILPLPLALRSPKYVFDKNIKIASVMGELLRKDLYRTLVHFSSSEVYGNAKYVPIDEEHPLEPSTSYGASKASQDLLLLSYNQTYDVDVRIIRPFNNIGKGQNDFSYSAVIPRTIKRILVGKPPEIYGDGMQTRDFIYVGDVCSAAMKIACMDYLKGEVLNIACGKEIKIRDLIKSICEIIGYKGEIIYKPARPGDIRRHFANIDKAKEAIGFRPKVDLVTALRIVIKWYKENVLH